MFFVGVGCEFDDVWVGVVEFVLVVYGVLGGVCNCGYSCIGYCDFSCLILFLLSCCLVGVFCMVMGVVMIYVSLFMCFVSFLFLFVVCW